MNQLEALPHAPLTATTENPAALLRPLALIFHVSRCGSTLLVELLRALNQVRLLSEPPILDQFLVWLRENHPNPDDAVPLLRGLVAALCYPQGEQERGVIIKCDAWTLFEFELLRHAFPQTPRILLFREPHKVLASHYRLSGAHMIPQLLPYVSNMPHIPLEPPPWTNYRCALLMRIYEQAARLSAQKAVTPLHYPDFLRMDFPLILDLLNINQINWDRNLLETKLHRDSKNPSQNFVSRTDPPHPGLEASPWLLRLELAYRELKQMAFA